MKQCQAKSMDNKYKTNVHVNSYKKIGVLIFFMYFWSRFKTHIKHKWSLQWSIMMWSVISRKLVMIFYFSVFSYFPLLSHILFSLGFFLNFHKMEFIFSWLLIRIFSQACSYSFLSIHVLLWLYNNLSGE